MRRKSDWAHLLTDRELDALEKRIAAEYKKAADELQEKIDEYFERFKDRDAKQKQLIGTIVNGRTYTEQDYKQWRLAQIGRGKRFEVLRDKIAERITKAKEIAFAYVNNDIPKIYALNRTYMIETIVGSSGDILRVGDFILFDEHTVKQLLTEQPDLMPSMPPLWVVNQEKEFEYGKRMVTAYTTQGIIQGQSVKQMAQHLRETFLGHYDRHGNWVPGDDITAAVRAARTAVTAAENAGRQDARSELAEKGVILKKRWIATNDNRTRHYHAEADGQVVKNDKPFTVGGEHLMFPGDTSMGASGWNLYNCRCSTASEIIGFTSVLTEKQRRKANIQVK